MTASIPARLCGVWLACLVLGAASQAARGDGFVPLTRSGSRPIQTQDAAGLPWYVMQNGSVQLGSNYPSSCGGLMIDGSGLSMSQPAISRDGKELQVTATHGATRITRRVRVDVKAGLCRFVDDFENTGSATVRLNIVWQYSVNGNAQQVVTDGGTHIAHNATVGLGKRESGLLIVRSQAGVPDMHSLAVYLAARGSAAKPTIRNAGNSNFYFTFPVMVEPGKSVAVLHGVSPQRIASVPAKREMAKLFAPFARSGWIRDLPTATRRTFMNWRPAADELSAARPLLQPLFDLSIDQGVERGPLDTLLVDESTHLAGAVEGEGLTLRTRFGETRVPRSEIAALVGGEHAIRLYLRNGDLLGGAVSACDLALQTDQGVRVHLQPHKLRLLMLRVGDGDGQRGESALTALDLRSGDRLTGRIDDEQPIAMATPWGSHSVPWKEVRSVRVIRDEQPLHRIEFQNGSRLRTILPQQTLTLRDTRFGNVELATFELERAATAAAFAPPAEEAEEAVVEPQEVPAAASPADDSRRELARTLLKSARQSITAGEFDEARRQAAVVRKLGVKLGPLDDSPERVLADIVRLEAKRSSEPAEPEAPHPAPVAVATVETPLATPTRLRLIGNNLLVGAPADPHLVIETAAGESHIATTAIAGLLPLESSDRRVTNVEVQLTDGSVVSGRLVGGRIRLDALGRVWNLPLQHVVEYSTDTELDPED